MGYRNYSVANGFTVDKLGNGDFTTISAAITAASSGQTIFIRPGTYNESPTLKAGVDLVAFVTDSDVPNVIINGKCTYTGAGNVGISGIELLTNSDYCLAITGSVASVVYINDCFINCLNHTGISFSSSSASSQLIFTDCGGNIATTGIALFAHSGAGALRFFYCPFGNTGNSTTNNTVSGSGGFFPIYSGTANGVTVSSTATMNGFGNDFTMSGNQTALTYNSTTAGNLQKSLLTAGSSSAVSIGAGATLQLLDCIISSSNGTSITGTGTLQFTTLTFNSVSSLGAGLTLSLGAMNTFVSGGGVGTSGQVFTSNGVTSPPTWQAASSGIVVQQVRASTTAEATLTTNIAAATTLPTTANGTSVVTVSITPTNSAHVLLIEGQVVCTSTGNNVVVWVIENATGNALASAQIEATAANVPATIPVRFYQAAGTTSSTAYALYAATVSAGSTFINANTSGTQLCGGTAFTSIQVTEYTA